MSIIKKCIAKLCGKRPKIDQLDFSQIKSILLKPIGDAIGDAIVHTAHLNQLRQARPDIHIGVFVTERNRRVFEYSGLVDEFLPDQAVSYFIQRKKWDLYLDFMPTFTSKQLILDKILSPNILINFRKEAKRYYNLETVKNYNHANRNTKHISDDLTNSILGKYINKSNAIYKISFPLINKINTNLLWHKEKIRIILSPEGSIKSIPPQELANIINGIHQELLDKTQFLLVSAKKSEVYFEQLKQMVLPQISLSLSPKTTLDEYFSLINSADIIVAVDSASVHIACAYSKPLLAFYANNQENIAKWSPKINLGVPYKLVLSQQHGNSNATYNFPQENAIAWLNRQISNFTNE